MGVFFSGKPGIFFSGKPGIGSWEARDFFFWEARDWLLGSQGFCSWIIYKIGKISAHSITVGNNRKLSKVIRGILTSLKTSNLLNSSLNYYYTQIFGSYSDLQRIPTSNGWVHVKIYFINRVFAQMEISRIFVFPFFWYFRDFRGFKRENRVSDSKNRDSHRFFGFKSRKYPKSNIRDPAKSGNFHPIFPRSGG